MAIPTASDKVILVDFSLTETNAFSLQPIDTQRQFSSTDKGTAYIGFKSENIENGMIADVSLANLDDDSRVNRKFEGKDKGLVVDYIGIKKNLNHALGLFNNSPAADDFEDHQDRQIEIAGRILASGIGSARTTARQKQTNPVR